MRIFRSAVFKVFPFLFFVLIWAFPEADEFGQSHSGNSLDYIISQLLRVLPTHLKGNEDFISTHKASLTQGIAQCLSAEYPRKNVLIYHQQNSTFEGTNAIHKSIELSSESNTTGQHTYEIQIFDHGTFILSGEDGYHNWAFVGNWSQKGTFVKFYPLEESLAKYRSGRTGAKLGGGYIFSSPNTTSLETRSSNSWSLEDNTDGSYDTVYDATAGSSDGDTVVYSAIDWSADGEAVADSSVLGPEAVVAVVIIAAVAAISGLLIDALVAWAHRNANERSYTQGATAQLSSALSTQNSIIFHNQNSYWDFVGWSHVHHELSLHDVFKQTVGYEIYTFDYGNFTLYGDGGFENWAFNGNWYRDPGSPSVIFYPRQGSGCNPIGSKARALNSDGPLRLRQPIPPQIPIRQHAETTDGHYLVDCVKPDKTEALGVAYYKDMEPRGGNIGQLPDAFAEVHSNHAGLKAWQGEGDVLLSARGTIFHWNFMHQDEQDDYVTVGTAHTATEQFWLYKDAGKPLFNSTMNWACSSLYYAF